LAEVRDLAIGGEIQSAFAALIGERCCRQRVGRGRSLSLGFGSRVVHSRPKAEDSFYGEWELGTYSAAWRIVCDERVICGSSDLVDSADELDERLQAVKLGAIVAIEWLSLFDIRLRLDRGTFIDFIWASTEDDEMFHIFGPESLYVEYTCSDGWKVGKSNTPWN
jgi:hypothetical protein